MAITLSLFLTSCAGTDSLSRILESSNAARVDPAPPGQPFDFVVSLRNVKDFGYDPDDKSTRDRQALSMLREQCPGGRIVGETIINTGQYALGNASRTYALQVRCRS